jgi:phosphoglycerate dehydrogenase-like enzyme
VVPRSTGRRRPISGRWSTNCVSVGGWFTAPMAAAAEKLRLVHAAGAGTDGIAFDASSSEMLVANMFHHEQSIAEYVLAAAVPPPTA